MNDKRDAQRLERLKKRYGYDEWPPAAGGELRGVRIGEDLLPEWRLDHADVLRQEGRPPMTHAILTRGEGAALSLEVWECASAAAARDLLLALLDEFESPEVERVTGPRSVGDVTFGYSEHMLLFARANLVVRVSNAGRELVPVEGPARAVEAGLGRQTSGQ